MLAGVLANIQPLIYMPDPSLYDFPRWAAEVSDLFGLTWSPIATEERWRDWADYLSSTPLGLQYGLPSSVGFAAWRDWAVRVLQLTG